jgi:hypothetical protein
MKTKFSIYTMAFALALFTFTSCVQDDDFDVPDEVKNIEEPQLNGDTVSITSVINNLVSFSGADQFTFEDTENYMVGYVVSSDEGGNFFRELILQDKAENPTVGIQVLIQSSPLFTKYNIGRKVYVKLEGFTVGTSNGVYALGLPDGDFLQEVPAVFEKKIVRSAQVDSIVPLPIEINQFSDEYENIFVQLKRVQFSREAVVENSISFAGEALDEFDGLRTIESCNSDATATLSTSTFADFKGLPLPSKSGTISGILTRTFEDDAYVVKINDPNDLSFKGERCDPLLVDCGLADQEGAQILFADDFEQQNPGDAISGNGWTNYAETGSKIWNAFYDSENNPSMGIGAKINASQANDDSNIVWLITPEIDLNANQGVTLTFETSNSFFDSSNLRVLFSSDWDGTENTIPMAEWAEIEAARVVDDGANYQAVIESGIVDLSCVENNGYVAFKYTGSGESDSDGTFELNDVRLAAE